MGTLDATVQTDELFQAQAASMILATLAPEKGRDPLAGRIAGIILAACAHLTIQTIKAKHSLDWQYETKIG